MKEGSHCTGELCLSGVHLSHPDHQLAKKKRKREDFNGKGMPSWPQFIESSLAGRTDGECFKTNAKRKVIRAKIPSTR